MEHIRAWYNVFQKNRLQVCNKCYLHYKNIRTVVLKRSYLIPFLDVADFLSRRWVDGGECLPTHRVYKLIVDKQLHREIEHKKA